MASIENMIAEIEKLNKALLDTSANIKVVESHLAYGAFNTAEVAQFNLQLESMNSSMSRMQDKKVKLQFLIDNRPIDDLQAKINALQAKADAARANIKTGNLDGLVNRDDPMYQIRAREIRGQITYLKSLETQIRKTSEAQSQLYIDRGLSGGTTVPDARLKLTGNLTPITDRLASAPMKAITEEINRMETAKKRLITEGRLTPVGAEFDALLVKIQLVNDNLNILLARRSSMNNGFGGVGNQQYGPIQETSTTAGGFGNKPYGPIESNEALMTKKLNSLSKEAAELQTLQTNAAASGQLPLPGWKERIDQVSAAYDRLFKMRDRVFYTAGNQPGHIPGGFGLNDGGGFGNQQYGPIPPPPSPTPKDIKDAERAAREAAKKAAEAARQAYMKQEAFAKESAFMAGLGYNDPETQFKKNVSVPGGAYSVSDWSRTDETTGKQYISKPRVDQQGNPYVGNIPKQNQSFAQGITKDLGDLMKWSIAISAIYGPINAASAAIKTMIENESKLADVSIALNDKIADTGKIFDDVYSAAQKSGEGTSLVIDAFGAAYTAAGRVTNEFDRYNTTIKLLDDSLVLSKLSTLDQAQAIDVLTSALYQSAKAPVVGDTASETASKALSRGTELIDKWIKVSKIAAVDVATLATGVAVLGDSAETAGLTIEELNAMIATLSEVSTGSSGKEIANVAKALIGNYQTEGAVKELNRLGVAVQDTSGKTRDYMTVMKDVAGMRSTGLIDDPNFQRLTLALGGGGIRRQKDVAAYLEAFGRQDQLTKAQTGGGGEGAEALAKKLDTVQTSSTKLANSLTSLAQTMGNEGGLLDVFTLTLTAGTGLVDIFDQLASKVGKVSPLLIGAGIGSLIMMGRGGSAGLANGLMNNMGMSQGWAGSLTGNLNPIEAFFGKGGGPGMGGSFGTGMVGSAFSRATTIPSLAAIALPAAQNFAAGDTTEAGANIAGGITGALVGGPIGALVGSAIAEAFVRTTITYKQDFADLFAGRVKAPEDNKPGVTVTDYDSLLKEANKAAGGGNEVWGSFMGWVRQQNSRENPGSIGLNPDRIGSFETPGSANLDSIKKSDPKLYAKLVAAYSATTDNGAGFASSKLIEEQTKLKTRDSSYLSGLQLAKQNELQTSLIKGDIKPADYANRMADLSAYTVTATHNMAALVDATGKLPAAFGDTKTTYSDFLDIASSGNQELIDQINAQVAAVEYYQNIVDTWVPGQSITNKQTGTDFTPDNKGQILDLINNTQNQLNNTLDFGAEQVRLATLPIRDIYGGNTGGATSMDVATNTADTVKAQKELYSNLTTDQYKSLQDSWEPFFVRIEESGKVFYKQVTDASGKNVDKSLYGEVWAANQAANKIASPKSTATDWQQTGATAAQWKLAESRAPGYIEQMNAAAKQAGIAPYKSDITDTIVSTADKSLITSHGDQKVISYLLQQILDTEKKQLQGIWNLPEGASIWVPSQSVSGTAPVTDPMGTTPTTSTDSKQNVPGEELSNYGYKNIQEMMAAAGDKKAQDIGVQAPAQKLGGDRWWEDAKPFGGILDNHQPITGQGTLPDLPNNSILDQLMNLFSGITSSWGKIGTPSNMGGENPSSFSLKDMVAPAAQALNAKMDLKFTSTTQLIVDGRMLAEIVKPYLAAEFIRANESSGTVTRSYVM